MPFGHDPEWQRTTAHPSAAALLAFLEDDLDRGMRLAWQIECNSTAGLPGPGSSVLLNEFEQVALEVRRWMDRAVQRNISLRHLAGRIDQFHQALANARCQADESR